MEKMLRIPLAVMVSVLSVFLVAGTASAVPCPTAPLTALDCGCVADIPGQTYTLAPGGMICGGSYGIIIGATGVTIDGNGNPLIGPGAASLSCEVVVYAEGTCGTGTRMWCTGHPCRNPLPSGIINANTASPCVPGVSCSCNSAAPAGQGGCNDVTIKNLEITGWCDGIFVSGDCDANNDGTDGDERKLTGLLIEGNSIHDNGAGPCGTFTQCSDGDGGDWQFRYYNDGIFTAEIGLPDENCSDPTNFPTNRNIIQDNIIYNQKGCATVSCPGGSGINLNGGLEEPEDGLGLEWGNCNDIRRNTCVNCAMSGIQFHHATSYSRIRQNHVASNGLGGIANACGWCTDNYILSNVAVDNDGCGIAARATATKFENNKCFNTKETTNTQYLKMADLGPALTGVGILADSNSTTGEISDVSCNISLDNDADDIICIGDGSTTQILGDNICKSCSGCTYITCTDYSSCAFGKYNRCSGDLDCDCAVDLPDFGILSGQWERGSDPSKPPCCP